MAIPNSVMNPTSGRDAQDAVGQGDGEDAADEGQRQVDEDDRRVAMVRKAT